MKKDRKENKNAEALFQAFNDLDESCYKNRSGECIDPMSKSKEKLFTLKKFAPVAAALLLVVASLLLLKLLPFGGNAGQGGNGLPKKKSKDGFGQFMSYNGPVLPLIMNPEMDFPSHLKCNHKLTYDFYRMNGDPDLASVSTVLLKDQYRIENSGQENHLKVLYPFVSSIDSMYYSYPIITQNGEALTSKLHYGSFTGDFVSALNEKNTDDTLNLKEYNSWEEYQAILDGRNYIAEGISPAPVVSDIPVTVYSFTNSYFPKTAESTNPTIVASIEIDRSKSSVLTLGFDGFAKPDDSNQEFYQYSIPKENENTYTEDKHYLIILGEDTPQITIETQTTGGWDAYDKNASVEKNNLKDAGADVKRQVMNLGDALDLALPILYRRYEENQISRESDFANWKEPNLDSISHRIDYEDFKMLYIRELLETGILSEKPMVRYEQGDLESLDVTNSVRVIFVEFELELKANQRIDLEMTSYKMGSYDFYGPKQKKHIYGYDLLTSLEKAMPVDKYAVEILDYNKVHIINQNFGFDLEKNIRAVVLSNDIPHYYMEVTEKK